jgi:hypothetical protein
LRYFRTPPVGYRLDLGVRQGYVRDVVPGVFEVRAVCIKMPLKD